MESLKFGIAALIQFFIIAEYVDYPQVCDT
jgi:hypothetical protein